MTMATEQTSKDLAIRNLEDISPYYLASLADCGSPDSLDSDGAEYLVSVRDGVVEWITGQTDEWSESDMSDGINEIADQAIDYRTHQRWSAFVDLQAYHEDVSDYATPSGDDLEATVCVPGLFIIGERLALALFERYNEVISDNTDDDDESDYDPFEEVASER